MAMQQLQDNPLRVSQVALGESIRLQFHHGFGSLLKTGRQHQTDAIYKGSQIVVTKPTSQLDLGWREDRLEVNDVVEVPGLLHGSCVRESQDKPLQTAWAEGHPNELTHLSLTLKLRGDGIVKGRAQRRVTLF